MVFNIIITLIILIVAGVYIYNKYIQTQHSILRQYPILGILRYLFEALGPEMRQYITDNDTEGKPFSRYIYRQVVKLGKYLDNITGFGSQRDFEKSGFFLANTMFSIHEKKLQVDNANSIQTFAYQIKKETLVSRHEKRVATTIKPYLLESPIVIGEHDEAIKTPWETKSFIGMSAMSYGSLGDHAIETLSHGLAKAGAWMNTGEGGLAPIHFVGGGPVIFQFGPAMFGVRNEDGSFSPTLYKDKTSHPQVVATEIKFHQGAKVKGGILPKEKITPTISSIRGIPLGEDCISPNAYGHIHDAYDLALFIKELKKISGKPVGIKIVMGQQEEIKNMLVVLIQENALPNFITIDGSEGGSGAAPQDMADVLGLPIFGSISILDSLLQELQVRHKVKIFASGKLATPDQIAVAMALGTDCINIARGLMMQLGCIQALKCNTNKCPVGVATQDARLQNGLVIEEKMYRVANYICTLRKHVFMLGAACGISTPTDFSYKHLVFQTGDGKFVKNNNIKNLF